MPASERFKHISPFGIIDGMSAYLDLVKENEGKFLGPTFEVKDGIYENGRACVRYTARQGSDFRLDVSEWYYIKKNQIEEIVSYYHKVEVRRERKLRNSES